MFQLRCQVEQVLLHGLCTLLLLLFCFSFKCCWHNVWGLSRQRAAVEDKRERSVPSQLCIIF